MPAEQKSILMLTVLAGLDGVIAPLDKSLKERMKCFL